MDKQSVQPCQPVSTLMTTCFQCACVSQRLGLKLLPAIDFLLCIDCNQHSKLNRGQTDDSNHCKETCGTVEGNTLIQLWCVEAQVEPFVAFSSKLVFFQWMSCFASTLYTCQTRKKKSLCSYPNNPGSNCVLILL